MISANLVTSPNTSSNRPVSGFTKKKLSTDLISGRWRVQGIDGVNQEVIYQSVWRGITCKVSSMVGDGTYGSIITTQGEFLLIRTRF